MNITITFPNAVPVPVPPPTPPPLDPAKHYFRGLHAETEGGRKPAYVGAPAVIPPYSPTVALEMTESIQWMSYDLMCHFCDAIDGDKWRRMHRVAIAMNNGDQNGFGGDIPHRDYVNREDLDAVKANGTPDLPRYDKMQRTFQGSIISGHRIGSYITCTPGVDAIDARGFTYKPGTPEAAVKLQKIIDNCWYSVAVGTGKTPYHIRAQWGAGCWIVYPFILDRSVSYDARFFADWNKDTPPDPLRTYVPLEILEPK